MKINEAQFKQIYQRSRLKESAFEVSGVLKIGARDGDGELKFFNGYDDGFPNMGNLPDLTNGKFSSLETISKRFRSVVEAIKDHLNGGYVDFAIYEVKLNANKIDMGQGTSF
jgi:hypothetical protein